MNDLVSGCGYSKNANHASGGGGGQTGTIPLPLRVEATNFIAEGLTHAHTCSAHNARFSSADMGGDDHWNITTSRNIPSDMLIDLTSDNTRVWMAESCFGKSYQ
jgi:hypothetical protein